MVRQEHWIWKRTPVSVPSFFSFTIKFSLKTSSFMTSQVHLRLEWPGSFVFDFNIPRQENRNFSKVNRRLFQMNLENSRILSENYLIFSGIDSSKPRWISSFCLSLRSWTYLDDFIPMIKDRDLRGLANFALLFELKS